MKEILQLASFAPCSAIGAVWALSGGVFEGLFVTVLLYACCLLFIQEYWEEQ